MLLTNAIFPCLRRCLTISSVPVCFHRAFSKTPTFHYHINNCASQSIHHRGQLLCRNVRGCRQSVSRRGLKSKRQLKEEAQQLELKKSSLKRSLLRPFFFTTAVVGVSFTGAIIWEYDTVLREVKRIKDGIKKQSHQFSQKMDVFKLHMSGGMNLLVAVVGANILVFLLWRIPRLLPFMTKYFTCQQNGPLSSMILSTFSHYGIFHLFINMFMFLNFTTFAINVLGKEQLAAFYISAGVVSSFTTIVNKTLRGIALPSLGASGALMGVLGLVCMLYPNLQLAFPFVGEIFPHSFSASSAVKGLLLFDLVGLLLGWRVLDHAAHLGGLLFGMWYAKYGKSLYFKTYRPAVIRLLQNVRRKP